MSDLFKKHRPRLSEDEERALWERVRTIPREARGRRQAGAPAPRRRAWWDALGASPAFRFGLPAVAAAVVAVVWVMQKEPVPPARQDAARRSAVTVPSEETAPAPSPAAPDQQRAQETVPPSPSPSPQSSSHLMDVPSASMPANEKEARPRVAAERPADELSQTTRDEKDKNEGTRRFDFATPPTAAGTTAPAPAAEPLAKESAGAKKDADAGAVSGSSTAGAAGEEVKVTTKQLKSVPASPQAVEGFYREKPQTGTIRAAEPGADASRVDELRAARGSRVNAALIGDRILVEVIAPAKTGTFLETVSLPISGGTARIAAANVPGSLWVEDGGDMRGLVRIAGYEGVTDAPSKRRVDVASVGGAPGAAALVAPDGRALHSRWVPMAGGTTRELAGPRSTSRSRAAALAAELVLALGSNDAATVVQVNAAARQLLAEHPNDPAARALVAWTDDARKAFASGE